MTDTNGFSGPGRVFERENLSGARFRLVDLAGARFEQANLCKVVTRGVELVDVESQRAPERDCQRRRHRPPGRGRVDRRDPERADATRQTPRTTGTAWRILERRWGETVDRARGARPRAPPPAASTTSGRSSRPCATSLSRPMRGSAGLLGDPDPGSRWTSPGTIPNPRPRATARPARPSTRCWPCAATGWDGAPGAGRPRPTSAVGDHGRSSARLATGRSATRSASAC